MAESSPLSNPNPVVVHQRPASIRAAGEAEDVLVSEVFGELEVGQMGRSGIPLAYTGQKGLRSRLLFIFAAATLFSCL